MIQEAHNRDLLASGARCLVNPVNGCGDGKGTWCSAFLAKYPTMLAGYRHRCAQGALTPGKLWMFQDPASGIWIANVAVRHRDGDPCQIEWVKNSLLEIARKVRQYEIQSIAIPALGCEDGGGVEWHQVQSLVEKAFERTRTDVLLYPPCPPKGHGRWSRR